MIELDPLGLDLEDWARFDRTDWQWTDFDVHYLPIAVGPGVAVCDIVENLGRHLRETPQPRRIVFGDLATVGSVAEHAAWAEAVRAIATLIIASGWSIPIIVYDSSSTPGRSGLARSADLTFEVEWKDGRAVGVGTARRAGTRESVEWSHEALAGPWPQEIAEMEALPPPVRR